MKRADIREAVESHLGSLGIERTGFLWQPVTAELLLLLGGGLKRIKLKSGMSRRALCFELGRITGWVESAGLVNQAHKINGASRLPNGSAPHPSQFAGATLA